MARVKLIGDPRDRTQVLPDVSQSHGFAFRKGEFTLVPDEHPSLRKLRGNGHFVVLPDEHEPEALTDNSEASHGDDEGAAAQPSSPGPGRPRGRRVSAGE